MAVSILHPANIFSSRSHHPTLLRMLNPVLDGVAVPHIMFMTCDFLFFIPYPAANFETLPPPSSQDLWVNCTPTGVFFIPYSELVRSSLITMTWNTVTVSFGLHFLSKASYQSKYIQTLSYGHMLKGSRILLTANFCPKIKGLTLRVSRHLFATFKCSLATLDL